MIVPRELVGRFARRLGVIAIAVAVIGCGSSNGSGLTDQTNGAAHRVRIENASTVVLTSVEVTTSETDAKITLARLSPGERSAFHGVAELHANPLVSVVAGGRSFIAHPVEGFIDGFNPRLGDGDYTVHIGIAEGGLLNVWVDKASGS